MALFHDIYFQLCDRFITKEQWNKRPYSSRHLNGEVNGYWPAYFPQRKLAKGEGSILQKTFWEMIIKAEDCIEKYGFLKTFLKMCTNLNNYVPVCPRFDDKDVEEQWGVDIEMI